MAKPIYKMYEGICIRIIDYKEKDGKVKGTISNGVVHQRMEPLDDDIWNAPEASEREIKAFHEVLSMDPSTFTNSAVHYVLEGMYEDTIEATPGTSEEAGEDQPSTTTDGAQTAEA